MDITANKDCSVVKNVSEHIYLLLLDFLSVSDLLKTIWILQFFIFFLIDAALSKKGFKSVKKKIKFRKSSVGEGGSNKVGSSRIRNESVGSSNSWGDEIPEYQRDLDMNELTEKDDTNEDIHHLENNITLALSNLMLSTSHGTNAPPTPLKTESPWVKIVNNYDKHQRIIQARLKVITAAKELSVQPTSTSFTKLVPMSQQNQNRSVVETSPISGITMTATDFPELQRTSPPIHYEHNKASGYKHRWETVG